MKEVLIVIDYLDYGGTAIALLNMLKFISTIQDINITLLPLVKEGNLINEVPKNISIIEIDNNKQKYLKPIRKTIKENKRHLLSYCFNLIRFIKKKDNMLIGERIRYNVINSLENNQKKYDLAIAYTDSSSLFYVSEKVCAKEKYVWVHMDYSEKNNRPIQHSTFYNKMDKIICVSKKAKKSFDSLNSNLADKTVVLRNKLDFKKIDEMKMEKVKEFNKDCFNIVSVGRLSKEKNHCNLIKCFAETKEKVKKDIKLYIIGDGIEKSNLKKLIKDLKLEKSCFLLGENKNPFKYMYESDLYVQTSIREGFGMTLYEAMYLAKPILSTRVPVTDELLENNKNAIIVENDNNAITTALINLVEDDCLRNYIKENIKEKADNIINENKEYIKLIKGDLS